MCTPRKHEFILGRYMAEVLAGTVKIFAEMIPTFMYADQTLDKVDLGKGLCQGELLVCVSCSLCSCRALLA